MEHDELLSDSSDSIDSPHPMTDLPTDSLKLPRRRRWNDWPWLFITAAAYYTFLSISLPVGLPEVPKLNGMIGTLNRIEIAITSSLITVGLGAVWIYVMLRYAKALLILSIGIFPIILSILIAVVATVPNPVVDAYLIIILLLVLVSGFIAIVYSKRQSLSISIQLLEFSCDVIRNNPIIWVIAISIMTIHGFFSIMWVSLFGNLIGDVKNQSNLVIVYYLFIYFLTASILSNIEKVVISGIVGDWYFDKNKKIPLNHLKYALSTSLGSVCFASFIQGILGTLKFSIKLLSRISFRKLEFITCTLNLLISIMEEWSPLALVNVGISGDDLWTSAKKCTTLFRRNLILGLLSSSISRILVFSGIIAISCCSGVAVGYISSYTMHNYTAVVMGGISTIIPFYMLRFIGQIIIHTMDSTFICYLLDLDANTCHCSIAHRLFAEI